MAESKRRSGKTASRLTQQRGRTKQSNSRQAVPKSKDPHWQRNFIILLVMSCLLGVIAYRSLNVYGYSLGGEAASIEDTVGYEVDGSNYKIEDEENHYLLFSFAEQEARNFCFYLTEEVSEELYFHASIFLGEEQIEKVDSVIPAGESYGHIYLNKTRADTVLLSVDGDFTLTSAGIEYYYEDVDSDDVQKKNVLQSILLAVFILFVLSAYLGKTVWMDQLITRCITFSKEKIVWLWNHKSKAACHIGIFALFLLLGNLFCYLLMEMILNAGWRISRDWILFGSMIGIIGFLLFRYLVGQKMKFEKLFLVCSLSMGTVLAISMPLRLNISWDDQIHFQRAASVSHIWQNTASLSEYDFYLSCFVPNLKNLEAGDVKVYNDILNSPVARQTASSGLSYFASYQAIVYLPVILVLFISRGLGLPMTFCLTLGKISSVWFFFLVIYLGMKRMKSGKMILAAVSMTPGLLFIISNYNYDYWLVALTMYGIAYLVGEYQHPERTMGIKDFLHIYVVFLLGIMVKPVYIPLLGMAAFLPKTKFKDQRYWKYYVGFFIGLVVCAIAGFAFLLFGGGLGTGDTRGGEGVNAGGQIQFILHNPLEYTRILLDYMKGYLSRVNIQSYLVDTAYILRKAWLGAPAFWWLVIISVLDRNKQENQEIGWMVKASSIPLAFASACCVATSMYVVFTGVGAGTIEGCQGRYLYPIYFPLLVVFSRIRFLVIPQPEKAKRFIEAGAMVVTLVISGIMMTTFL